MAGMAPKVIPIAIGVGLLIIIIIGLVASSLRKLNSDELGLQYDNIAKHLGTKAQGEGLHVGPPGFSFIIFPSIYQTMEHRGITCLNRDGVIIDLSVSYQFKANPNYLRTLVEQFKDFSGYKAILLSSGTSAVHDTCANFSTNEFQTDRGRFQERLRDVMRTYCESLYCELNDLQVNEVRRPTSFEQAVKDKETAKENIRVAENSRPQELLKAETAYEEAKKQAEIILDSANTEAKILLTKAKTEVDSLKLQYQKDLEVYKQIKSAQGLDNEGFLSYLAVRAIANSKNEVNLAMKSPARTSYTSVTD